MRVSVLTPTIPERADLLEECIASVTAQTFKDMEQLIGVDEGRRGCSWMMNQLAQQAKGEWVIPFADDDLLLPGAVARLLEASDDADVVYSPPLVSQNGETHFFGVPPDIPSFGLIRRTLWQVLGGYDTSRSREEDRDLWTRALKEGARFVRIGEPQYVYRFHARSSKHQNKSYHGGVAS